MNEKQFKQQSHDLVVNIASTIGTFTTGLELTDDDLAKTQELVKKFDETLTEFIDSRKPKFEIGDYVVDDSCGYMTDIASILEDGSVLGYKIYDLECASMIDAGFGCSIRSIRYATTEEIAEYEVALTFHKHGRKPFDVKGGDLLENVFGKYIAHEHSFSKEDFTVGGNTLLKTAEEVNEWLGADDE